MRGSVGLMLTNSRRIRRPRVGRDGNAGGGESMAHVGLVDGELKRTGARTDDDALGRQGGHHLEVDLLVVESHGVAPFGQRAKLRLDEGRPEHDLGRHAAGGVVGALGEHRHRQTEGTRCLAGHAGQLPGPHEPDVMPAQVASLPANRRRDAGEGHERQERRERTAGITAD